MNIHQMPAPIDEIEAMFVQIANSTEAHDGTLTLHGLAPSTLYFSDRPQRVVGHLTNQQFVRLWTHGENSFYDDPPNAVLAFIDDGEERLEDVVLVLFDPHLDRDVLTYTVQVLEWSLPTRSGPCSLFIDPLGRPVPPTSLLGMHRRTSRSARSRWG
jgi:hypothetical protein